jgi:hypothetical protein
MVALDSCTLRYLFSPSQGVLIIVLRGVFVSSYLKKGAVLDLIVESQVARAIRALEATTLGLPSWMGVIVSAVPKFSFFASH